jgi:hypothetical protein
MHDPEDWQVIWRIADPFELALFVGALAALANRHQAFLDEQLSELAVRCLVMWPPRAQR